MAALFTTIEQKGQHRKDDDVIPQHPQVPRKRSPRSSSRLTPSGVPLRTNKPLAHADRLGGHLVATRPKAGRVPGLEREEEQPEEEQG